ncbi:MULTISPECIES: hypothetical protein [unclassified Oleiphilus]|uniref:hypothetical protein n=1 Tax=unclassified Oleiphilus TaxID=2631174 RepID=UPI0007C28F47|nr:MULTISPECIES: hypothetical protein [unclassified Oleiphilus]KZY43926.1 hypothetical protein A3732_13345 [Oleiphilus sp. HI0050]KZZ34231.1 hypothetical protein A3757_18140 [Oleiphilus sp. HI0117]KZZ34264.1 hypothetical protein A3756_03410 [Oleiphilus sp. HI0086]KZZ53835.1 hypothetical protein A3761_15965 [Oleiphilus sp. HI0123]
MTKRNKVKNLIGSLGLALIAIRALVVGDIWLPSTVVRVSDDPILYWVTVSVLVLSAAVISVRAVRARIE